MDVPHDGGANRTWGKKKRAAQHESTFDKISSGYLHIKHPHDLNGLQEVKTPRDSE